MKRKIAITLFIFVAFLSIWYVVAPRISWDGSAAVQIVVTVVEEGTLEWIANAIVQLRHPRKEEAPSSFSPEFYDRIIVEGTTDQSGTARIVSGFGAGGSSGFFGRSGQVVYTNVWLQVSAPEYKIVRTRLSQFTGETRSIRLNQNTEITISLAATPNEP